jgi:hypothetical protein
MRSKLLIFFSFAFLFAIKAQTLKYEFVKSCLDMPETEMISYFTTHNFNFIAKDHVNLGDNLINRSDYYSSKTANSTDSAEIAVFINKRKSSKKSIVFSFTEPSAHQNFEEIEEKIKNYLTKEGAFLSERYNNVNITKYSEGNDFFYVFRDDFIYYIIVTNYPLDDNYFKIRTK